jgi:hypothetical protein
MPPLESEVRADMTAGAVVQVDRSFSRRELLRGAAAAAVTVGVGMLPSALRVSVALAEPPGGLATEQPADAATLWFRELGELVAATPGFSPPVASRALGYAGVALHETVVAGVPGGRRLAGRIVGLDAVPPPRGGPHHWGAAANAALATVARALWPTAPQSRRTAVDGLEGRLAARFAHETPRGVAERSALWGRSVAAAVLDRARQDGGHEGFARNFPTDYHPPQGPGLWVPTPPAFLPALQPFWGDNLPLCLTAAADCVPGTPTPWSADPTSDFHAEALEVHDAVDGLTAEQLAIARFWADDPGVSSTPPGHAISITTLVLEAENADLATAAEAYAKAGIAVADAFIACWHAKYTFNLLRPITHIQDHIVPGWGGPDRPLPVTTPPFPEYPSGHSVQSAAAAEVLSNLFGDPYAFTDTTHAARGMPARSFPSFHAAAAEAAISRLYGGIHFRPAIVDGQTQGRCIGEAVNRLVVRG